MIIMRGIDIVLFLIFSINVIYLLIFSLASCRRKRTEKNIVSVFRRIAILIPAYREDCVIMECVESCMHQEYPKDKYDIVVISDQMESNTNEVLSALPIILEIARFKNSTKAKALNLAMSHLNGYDIALILDADNMIKPDFLLDMNRAFEDKKISVFQAHRVAKNTNTNLAFLDAVSEEINNSIFRLGHMNLGFSAALIGSGMAFDYDLLKTELAMIPAVGGFDRALELTLFKSEKRIGYLPNSYVLDEKIQTHSAFFRQRRRWMSAQVHYFMEFLKDIPFALKTGNWDFCDKMFQQMSIPRIILLGVIVIMAVSLSIFLPELSVKWWILLSCLIVTLGAAIPKSMFSKKLFVSMIELPVSFAGMFINLFRLKDANKGFIHTEHGIK